MTAPTPTMTLDVDREILHAHRESGLALRRVGRENRHDSAGVRERQPLEDAAVDDAEDGRAEADADTKSEDGDERQRWIPDQHPNAARQVAEESVHGYPDEFRGRPVRRLCTEASATS